MMKRFLSLALIALIGVGSLFAALPDKLTTYTLDNGLTVYLWEDKELPDVQGWVATRVGAVDEPVDYTGLAHYLEHMLFKGNQEIGALDWEKEKPLYEQIIALYDVLSETTDKDERQKLTKQINELSREAAQYTKTDDFSNMIEAIGGEGLNAFTSYDMTCYFNSFPNYEMEKWLTIYSDRLINPVFRSFQAELENVFEEYNLYQDEVSQHQRTFISEHIYSEKHPYARDVIGSPEHLKNPRLSKLIEFYNTWYVPNNMALILVGNFDKAKTQPLIEKTFGRLQKKELPQRPVWEDISFAGNQRHKANIGYSPEVIWVYNGVTVNSEDALPLQFVIALLNNGMQTGLLDKLTLDGIVSGAGAYLDSRRDLGRIMVVAMPYYDVNQRTFEPNETTAKTIFKEIDKLKTGNIEEWLFNSVKEEYFQAADLMYESSQSITQNLMQAFIYELPLERVFSLKEQIAALTLEDIQRVAKKYFNQDHITIEFEEGDPKKHKLAKPDIQPLDPPQGKQTEYSKRFKQIPQGEVEEVYNNFADVQQIELDPQIKLYYTKNDLNNIFSITLNYGIGTEKMPKLDYAVSLMNTAGIMPSTDSQQFRRQLAELGGSCSYSVNDSYFNATISGKEENLAKICQLVQKQMLMPKLEQRQLENVQSQALVSRIVLPRQESVQTSALINYAIYGKKSPYIDVVPFADILNLTIPQLHAEFQKATEYSLKIHYVGAKPIEEVKDILMGNLPLKEGMKPSESPIVKERVTYDKQTIFFLPNANLQQANIYFYIDGDPYEIAQDVAYDAFDQYFSGGFSGLVMNEIREKRSMAYTAYGSMRQPSVTGKKSYFLGYVGSQSDKVADAIDVYMDLLTNMPQYPEKLDNIKTYLRQTALTAKPSMRNKSFIYAFWQRIGYTDDPAKVNMDKINNLTFDEIVSFYKEHIQGKPITIVITGDPKKINKKQIQANHGKITNLSKNRLFAPLDLDY